MTAPAESSPDSSTTDSVLSDAPNDPDSPDAEVLDTGAPVHTEPSAAEPDGAEATSVEPTDAEPTEAEPAEAEPAEAEPAVLRAVPTPSPRPMPRPSPRLAPAVTESSAVAWGRVDSDGSVFVREGQDWRKVGEYPDGSSDEALAYYARKFADLADKVRLLEQRHRGGGASATELRGAARHLAGDVDGAAAVGDLASLSARITALTDELGAASELESAAAREAVAAALRERTELVEKAEALAARDPKSIQWKQVTVEVAALFDQWQSHQQDGPRLPKSAAQGLWKRFRDARAILDKHRREFYAELDEVHKGSRDRKTRLVEKAEALGPKGEDGIGAYRELLDQWKTAGRAGKKVDDALWNRFKAAGDALYGARADRDAAEAEASREHIETRQALLEEAAAVSGEKDLTKARSMLTAIQRRWDETGRIFPRDKERTLDDALRKIEQALRTREDNDWKRNNPETKARANDMTRQLEDAIEKLEGEIAAAEKAGDKKTAQTAKDALKARQAWLAALGA